MKGVFCEIQRASSVSEVRHDVDIGENRRGEALNKRSISYEYEGLTPLTHTRPKLDQVRAVQRLWARGAATSPVVNGMEDFGISRKPVVMRWQRQQVFIVLVCSYIDRACG